MDFQHIPDILNFSVYPPLSGSVKNSFAFVTLAERLPVILTKLIDSLSRLDTSSSPGSSLVDVIKDLATLKHELISNKQLTPLITPLPLSIVGASSSADVELQFWNSLLIGLRERGVDSWFEAPWLFAECYLYRRIAQSFHSHSLSVLQDNARPPLDAFDWFGEQKIQSFHASHRDILSAAVKLETALCKSGDAVATVDELRMFIFGALWGNQSDLSISAGRSIEEIEAGKHQDHLVAAQTHMISDHSSHLISHLLANSSQKGVLHVVLDNAGAELFMDLCLADYLVSRGIVGKIMFHVKSYPWFISDVTTADFHEFPTLLLKLEQQEAAAQVLEKIGTRWQTYIESGVWNCVANVYWNLPVSFTSMKKVAPALYAQMTSPDSILWIFKGDLNYRKLVGDLSYPAPFTTPFSEALGDLGSAVDKHRPRLVALRTTKANVVVGLEAGVAQALDEKEGRNEGQNGWLVSGKYALIQFD